MLERTSHPSPLVALSQHDDDGRLLLQNHLPEVVAGLGQRPLRGDVLPGVRVALNTRHQGTGVSAGSKLPRTASQVEVLTGM